MRRKCMQCPVIAMPISSYIFPSLPHCLFLSALGAIKPSPLLSCGTALLFLGPLKVWLLSSWLVKFLQINILYATWALLPLPAQQLFTPACLFCLTKKKKKIQLLVFQAFPRPACYLVPGDSERLMLSWYKRTDSAGRTPLSFSFFLPRQMPWFLGLNHLITLEVMAEQAKSKTTFRFHWAASLALLISFWTYCHGREQNLIWPFLLGFCCCHLINTVLFMENQFQWVVGFLSDL